MADPKYEELVDRYSKLPVFWEMSGNDPNEKGLGGDAMLHIAAMNNRREDVGVLIDQGADVNLGGDLGRTALHIAASRGHSRMVRYLLSRGADRSVKDELGETPASLAEVGGHIELHFLLSKEI